MRKGLLAIAAAAALTASTAAHAAQIFFSTSADKSAASPNFVATNPTITVPVGGTATLYVWAIPATTDVKINGLALSADASSAGKITGVAHVVGNPINANDPDTPATRWDAVGNGTLPAGGGWANDNAVATSMLGIRQSNTASTYGGDGDSAFNGTTKAFLLSTYTFTGNQAGQTDLFLKVGANTISNTASAVVPVFFGAGDTASGAGNTAGAMSTTNGVPTPDATIIVGAGTLPEPTALSLVGIAGLGLVRRRRA